MRCEKAGEIGTEKEEGQARESPHGCKGGAVLALTWRGLPVQRRGFKRDEVEWRQERPT